MKRFGNLWEKIISKENIRLGVRRACKSTCNKTPSKMRHIKYVKKHFEQVVDEIHELLVSGKYKTSNILNKEVTVLRFRVGDSKKREGTKYITIQVEVDGKHRVVFTGSEVLYNQLIKYQEHLPFIAIIRKINDFYSFT